MSIDKNFYTTSSSKTTKRTLLMAFATIINEFAEIISEQRHIILKQEEENLELLQKLHDATSKPSESVEA